MDTITFIIFNYCIINGNISLIGSVLDDIYLTTDTVCMHCTSYIVT